MGRGRELIKFAWQAAAIAAAASTLVYFAAQSTSYKDLNLWTYDFTVLAGGDNSVSKDVVLVDIDEESFRRIGKYPIPRDTIAKLLGKISDQGAKIVGMDIFLSEARNGTEDAAMQAALTHAGNVILASQNSSGILPPVIPLPIFCQPEDAKAAQGFCIDGTRGALGYAFINLNIDSDGFIRQAQLIANGPHPAESFPLMLAEQYTGKSLAAKSGHKRKGVLGHLLPRAEPYARFLNHTFYFSDTDTNSILIGSWKQQPVLKVSAWQVLSGDLPAGTLAGKLVLIGQTNDAARDRLLTPVFRHEDANGQRLRLGGTEVLAAAIRSLLEGTVVRSAPQPLIWGWVIAVCFVASFILLASRPAYGIILAALLMTVPCLITIAFYARSRFWLPFLPVQLGVAVTLPLSLGLQFILERVVAHEAREQRKELMKLFSSYVDPAVAQTIWERRSELSLSGEERVATVVFSDIRNFTKLSAGRPPAEVLRWLNQYVTAMDQVIREYDGFLNKFIGDGLMIIFGLPLSHGPSEDAKLAVEASLAMLERVESLNEENAGDPTAPQLRIGIGIHTGSLMAGSIGSASRQEYSVIGSTVNLASRLESLNKPFKTEILMSQATRDMVAKDFSGIRPLGGAKVAGLEEEIAIYTIEPQQKFEMLTEILKGDLDV